MGIRYYAYSFDRELTAQALANPRSMISDDPLADAWGFEPGATVAVVTFKQAVAERDMLYLDKAWQSLQALTETADDSDHARPSFRMFEGNVTWSDDGWFSWVRALSPDEIPAIAHDLAQLDDARREESVRSSDESNADDSYVDHFLHRARCYAEQLALDGRGMVYTIG